MRKKQEENIFHSGGADAAKYPYRRRVLVELLAHLVLVLTVVHQVLLLLFDRQQEGTIDCRDIPENFKTRFESLEN